MIYVLLPPPDLYKTPVQYKLGLIAYDISLAHLHLPRWKTAKMVAAWIQPTDADESDSE